MMSDYDPENLSEQIAEIVEEFDGPALGVARQLIQDDNLDRLTPKQRYWYDKEIVPALIDLANRKETMARQERWDRAGD